MSQNTQGGKSQYAIMRLERVTTFAGLKRISNHNDRTTMSENINPDGPPPQCLYSYGSGSLVNKAHQRMAELGIDKSSIKGKVVAVEIIVTATKEFFENALPEQFEAWKVASIGWLQQRCGEALIDIQLHLDEEVPHMHAVSIAAIQKVRKKRGPQPKDLTARAALLASYETTPKEWTLSFKDMFGGKRERLSEDQDSYHATVASLGLARGEKNREDREVDLGDEIMGQALYTSTGKRRHIPPAEYRKYIKRLAMKVKAAEQESSKLLREVSTLRAEIERHNRDAANFRKLALDEYSGNVDQGVALMQKEAALHAHQREAEARLQEREKAFAEKDAESARLLREIEIREVEFAERKAIADRLEIARKEAVSEEKARQERAQHELVQQQTLADDIARLAALRGAELKMKEQEVAAARLEQEVQGATARRQLATAKGLEAAAQAARNQIDEQLRAMTLRQSQLDDQRADIAAGRATLVAEKAQAATEFEHHHGLLGLLERAADPLSPLYLRVGRNTAGGEVPVMRETAMTDAEEGYYRRGWPGPIRKVALLLAKALDGIRAFKDRLARQEHEVGMREQKLISREAQAAQEKARDETERRRLSLVITNLDKRGDALDARAINLESAEADIRIKQAELAAQSRDIEASVSDANATMMAATRSMAEQEEWASIIDHVVRRTWKVASGTDEVIRLIDRESPSRPLPDWACNRVGCVCPRWAQQFLHRYAKLEEIVTSNVKVGSLLAEQSHRLKEMIDDAGPILTPSQSSFAASVKGELQKTEQLRPPALDVAVTAQAQAAAAARSR